MKIIISECNTIYKVSKKNTNKNSLLIITKSCTEPIGINIIKTFLSELDYEKYITELAIEDIFFIHDTSLSTDEKYTIEDSLLTLLVLERINLATTRTKFQPIYSTN